MKLSELLIGQTFIYRNRIYVKTGFRCCKGYFLCMMINGFVNWIKHNKEVELTSTNLREIYLHCTGYKEEMLGHEVTEQINQNFKPKNNRVRNPILKDYKVSKND